MDIIRSTNGAAVEPGPVRGNYLEIFLVFLRLGLTSFGGPIAHLGYFRQEFVERRKWLILIHKGFWPAEAEARTDYSMFMSTLFLLIVGGGLISLDAWWAKKANNRLREIRTTG